MNLSLYFVTPDGLGAGAAELALEVARGGATIVQLRDKQADTAARIATARAMKAALAPLGAPLIVNDDLEAALGAGADGLHIGQGDGDPAEIRRALGPERILGLSIETRAQLDAIPPGCVDYLGVGPLRATATKPDAAAPLGVEGVAEIIAATALPCVVIGGLGEADLPALKRVGAKGVAVVSALASAPDPCYAARTFSRVWSES